MKFTKTLTSIVAAGTMMVSATAFAQIQKDFQAEHFEPLPDQRTNLLNLAKTQPIPHLAPGLNLFLHFADDELQVIRENDSTDAEPTRLLDDQLRAEIGLAMGFFDFMDIGVILPLVAYQTGDDQGIIGHPNETVESFAIQDLRIVPKVRFIDPEWAGGFGAGLSVPIYIPIGDKEQFAGTGDLRFEPRLALDWFSDGGFGIVGNVAYQIRESKLAKNFVQDDAIRWGAGLEIPISEDSVTLLANVFGEIPLEEVQDGNELVENAQASPIEALAGLRFLFGDVHTQLGGGMGLTDGVGAPDFRVFGSIGWTPMSEGPVVGDADGDGIMDDVDGCVDEPEDFDEFEDEDGCPDVDNDQDGVLDTTDECPMDPEDVDTFEDENGCPDPDNDKDGVLDVDDKCPMDAGEAVNNGCPNVDTDGDGILDAADKCPADPEDKDGFEDSDGCPDRDNDQDGFLDKDDKCPMEPETINGNKDDDGCPDKGKSKVKVVAGKIEILEKVFFDSNKAKIKKRSYNVLTQVASVLKAYKNIKKVRIEGHTDSRGKDSSNLSLSKRRAQAVLDFLVGAGIDAGRLDSEGFGEANPIASNDSKSGRASNRRVEFVIVDDGGAGTVNTK